MTLPARVSAHVPQFFVSPSHYLDLIGNVLTQSLSFRGLSGPWQSPLARSASRGNRGGPGRQSVFPIEWNGQNVGPESGCKFNFSTIDIFEKPDMSIHSRHIREAPEISNRMTQPIGIRKNKNSFGFLKNNHNRDTDRVGPLR